MGRLPLFPVDGHGRHIDQHGQHQPGQGRAFGQAQPGGVQALKQGGAHTVLLSCGGLVIRLASALALQAEAEGEGGCGECDGSAGNAGQHKRQPFAAQMVEFQHHARNDGDEKQHHVLQQHLSSVFQCLG
jgi:hypothetical protein